MQRLTAVGGPATLRRIVTGARRASPARTGRRRIPVAGLLLSLATPGVAQEASEPGNGRLVANRPGFSSVAEVVPRGRLELNTGLAWSRVEAAETASFGQVLIRAGLGRGLELRAGLNSWVSTDAPGGDVDGLEDAVVGLKLGLSPGSGFRPQASLIVETSVPTGADDVGNDDLQPKGILVLAWDLTSRVHLDSNFALASQSEGGDRYEEASTSFAFGVALAGDLAAYLEYAGFFPLDGGRSEAHFLFAALTWISSPRCQLDFGVGQGLNSADPDWTASAGVAYRW